jgi:hypothetical protein
MNKNDDTPVDALDMSNGTHAEFGRRGAMRRLGFGAAAVGAMTLGGAALNSTPARATSNGAGPSDADIFNFALNLEYLEAQFYLFAVTGQGLPADMLTGTGNQGAVSGGAAVPFKSPAIQAYAQRIAVDEMAHVNFIRAVLGSSAIAQPTIDVSIGPNSSFSKLAVAAGLIVQGQTFNPYADDVSFLLGASIFEDVGVTAYAGAARYIGNPDYLEAAAGILAVEAYHSGAIRSLLADLGAGQAFDAISNLRGILSSQDGGLAAEQPILLTNYQSYNFLATDDNSLAFRRNTSQVLNIVYGGGTASGYLFFPNKLNGSIS